MIAAVVFDLDGVIRHFESNHQADVEQRHGLEPGSLWRAGFSSPHIDQMLTGKMTRAEWVTIVGELVNNPQAAVEWLSAPATVDEAMRQLLIELQAADVTVALLTNGTDTVEAELHDLNLHHLLDRVFNTHHIGHRKPTPEIYNYVGRQLNLEPQQIWFTDDSTTNVEAAQTVGWLAEAFTDAAVTRSALVNHRVLPDPDR